MSIKIMAQVWSDGPTDKAQLLVLLALADFADDQGNCWPSVAAVGVKARMSERNARRVIRDLEERGYLSVVTGGGRFGCSQYVVTNPDKIAQNPDKTPPGQNVPPGQNQHNTRTKPVGNPDIAMSAEPSRTIKEPSVVSKEADGVRVELTRWASEAAADSFIAYRRKHKSKALTLTGAVRLSKHLSEIFNAGGDPSDALGMAEERGWASVEPDWYFRNRTKTPNLKAITGGRYEPSTATDQFSATQGRGDRADPAIEQITRLVRARQASSPSGV